MNLALIRKWFTAASVTGEFFIREEFQCFSLELPLTFEEKENVPQKTCIPEGTYEIELYPSKHFKRMLPILKDVKKRSGILIHPANEPHELLGCIAVGKYRGRDYIGQSRVAFDELFQKIQFGMDSGEIITITISHQEVKPI
jgi:hypothetical protein